MARKDPGPRSMVRFIGRVIEGSKPGKHPGFVEPQQATLRAHPPSGDKYIQQPSSAAIERGICTFLGRTSVLVGLPATAAAGKY
jgi:hypothetical protein